MLWGCPHINRRGLRSPWDVVGVSPIIRWGLRSPWDVVGVSPHLMGSQVPVGRRGGVPHHQTGSQVSDGVSGPCGMLQGIVQAGCGGLDAGWKRVSVVSVELEATWPHKGQGSKAKKDGPCWGEGVQVTPWVLTLSSLLPAVSSQKRLQARPQQPAPSVPGCAAQLPAWPPTCRLHPECCPWQQRCPSCSRPHERPGCQGQPSAQPQCGHPRPLRPGCGPTSPQWAQQRPAPAPQRPAWGGRRRWRWWGKQRRRWGRWQAERCHQ